MNSIAPGACADGDHRIPNALGLGADEILLVHEADAHRVDERIPFVRGVENDLSGDGWNADAVAVVADALDDAGEQVAHPRAVETAEAERVEHRDRTRAHGEDV